MTDHLAEEFDALIETCCVKEGLWAQIDNRVEETGELRDHIHIDSVLKVVYDARLESLLHCLG